MASGRMREARQERDRQSVCVWEGWRQREKERVTEISYMCTQRHCTLHNSVNVLGYCT